MKTSATEFVSVLEDIEDGSLDHMLDSIANAVKNRQTKIRASLTISDYPVGTKVVFNDKTGTRYMVGVTGTVVGHKVKKVVVQPDTAIGRFNQGAPQASRATCPIEILDIIK